MTLVFDHLRRGALKPLLVLWFSVFVSVVAAEEFNIDPHLIDRCLGVNQDTPMFCVGRQTDACYDAHDGGADMVLGACQAAELAYWDGALNQVYKELMTLVAREEQSDVGYLPKQLTNAAREMQRTWIAYRDATCGLDLARAYPFGSAAGPASQGCHLRETARQYFQLQTITGSYR